ncbi:hypothetical protein BJ508DRAFT_410965 [Ascobolus immersus RN42]|uniref:Uncharacterized protein n=1 Tax=Ascobolus immersus RN42 TaxID=1160509 RepID=A0A3N4IRD0_ASCIM|nr:hypothetical protein BJ508DRAFT_410965 [Ascobolus immersus RN42]
MVRQKHPLKLQACCTTQINRLNLNADHASSVHTCTRHARSIFMQPSSPPYKHLVKPFGGRPAGFDTTNKNRFTDDNPLNYKARLQHLTLTKNLLNIFIQFISRHHQHASTNDIISVSTLTTPAHVQITEITTLQRDPVCMVGLSNSRSPSKQLSRAHSCPSDL